MTEEKTPWWGEANAADSRDARRVIHEFLDAPNPDHADKFSRALALCIFLGGADLSIREKIDKIDGHPQAGLVRDALSACQTKLSQFPDAMPDWFEKSAEELGKRADKAFNDRVEHLKRTARRFKFKPQG